jgi:hypothetical protein
MPHTITPMIHVPDVRATAAWYAGIGFTVLATHEDDGVLDWALLALGDGRVMLNIGGRPSTAHRREADLYVEVADVRALAESLRGRVEIVEDVHETEYGMRELIVRDLNRFWITFGQALPPEAISGNP